MIYFTDKRQYIHFEHCFRAVKLVGISPEKQKLEFIGFGTINGKDGKPFKTRDGGVMELESLLDMVKHAVRLRVKEDIPDSEAEEISEMLTIATIKYADLLPFRGTDYIFDVEKFSELEGKTGPYLLYSTIRMKSLLAKAGATEINFSKLNGGTDMEVAKCLFSLPQALLKAYNDKSLNEICEYLYRLTSCYNKFYAENRILTEEDTCLKASWLGLTKVCLEVNRLLLDILAIKVPEKM
jgi:arginyl-tRNA synthetase